jgi:cell division protein FtsN
MEKQKIFWVVLSVSVFVVIVLIVGVYLLRQKPTLATTTSPGTINPITGPGPQVFEYSPQNPQAQPGAGTEPKPGEPQTMHFYIGEGGDKGPRATAPQATPPQGTQPPAPTTLTPPVSPSTAPPATSLTPATPAPAVKSVPAPPVIPRAKAVAAPHRKTPPAARTAVKPRQVRPSVDYWIQTGSYKSQSKAEELIATLADKGLSGKVFSYDAHDGTYYRVRIGPYSNHGEADKFLSIVKQIQGLESSYVSQVTSKT